MNETDIYELLRQAVDEVGVGFPKTTSGVEIRMLKKLFTEQEAAMYIQLTRELETPEEIAERTNQDPKEVAVLLKHMTEKGLTFPKRKRDTFYYARAPFGFGIMEHQLNRLDKEYVDLYDEFLEAEQIQDPNKGPQTLEEVMPLRVIPVMEPTNISRSLAPYQDAREIIKGKDRIALVQCVCQAHANFNKTGNCDHPSEVCLIFGFYAEYYVEIMKLGRWITQEEALKVLEESEKAGLIHQPANSQDPEAICNCCWNCCGMLHYLRKYPNPGEILSSGYFARVDAEICNACETCVDRCPAGAVTMKTEDVAEVDMLKCIGCGLCVSTCHAEAITLMAKPDEECLPIPAEHNFMRSSEKIESRIR